MKHIYNKQQILPKLEEYLKEIQDRTNRALEMEKRANTIFQKHLNTYKDIIKGYLESEEELEKVKSNYINNTNPLTKLWHKVIRKHTVLDIVQEPPITEKRIKEFRDIIAGEYLIQFGNHLYEVYLFTSRNNSMPCHISYYFDPDIADNRDGYSIYVYDNNRHKAHTDLKIESGVFHLIEQCKSSSSEEIIISDEEYSDLGLYDVI